jgi:hypothetical protein
MAVLCCESCWICCAPDAMRCDHEDDPTYIKRIRSRDSSWTSCIGVERETAARDWHIQHAAETAVREEREACRRLVARVLVDARADGLLGTESISWRMREAFDARGRAKEGT